jgi:phage antirepressor YoqD-like protein
MNLLPVEAKQTNELAVQTLQALSAVNAQQAARIEELESKAEEYARFLECKDTLDMASAASRISEALGVNIGRTNLYKLLREMGLLYADRNRAKREFEERGYFKNGQKAAPDGEMKEFVRVTPKGLSWLVTRIQESTKYSGAPAALITRHKTEENVHE